MALVAVHDGTPHDRSRTPVFPISFYLNKRLQRCACVWHGYCYIVLSEKGRGITQPPTHTVWAFLSIRDKTWRVLARFGQTLSLSLKPCSANRGCIKMLHSIKHILVCLALLSSMLISNGWANETPLKTFLIAYYQVLVETLESVAPGSFLIKKDNSLASLPDADLQEYISDMEDLLSLFPTPRLEQQLFFGTLLLDTPAEGVQYQTASHSSLTGTNGQFIFKAGETVTFFIGDIALGHVDMRQTSSGSTLVTPKTLATTRTSNAAAQTAIQSNIVVLLHALDQDNNPDNGITITEQARQRAVGVTTLMVTHSETAFVNHADLIPYIASAKGMAEADVSLGINHSPTGVVTLVGNAVHNSILTASHTLVDEEGVGPIRYQWQHSADGLRNWTPIMAETASTFLLSQVEVGQFIRVLAHYTDGQGNAEAVASTATGPVATLSTETGFGVRGILVGLNRGESARLIFSSQSRALSRMMEVQGREGEVPFVMDNLPSADDYRLQVQSENHPDGYWGGTATGEVSAPVGWDASTALNLTQSHVSDVWLQLAVGYTLTVTVNGVNKGDVYEINAWSASTRGFEWQSVTATETSVTARLSGLPVASDYIISIASPTEGVRGGVYTGALQPPGPLLKAAPVALNGHQSITLTMVEGSTLSGTLSNLIEGNRAWVEAWSKETSEYGMVEVTTNGTYTLQGLAAAKAYTVCVKIDNQAGGCYGGRQAGLTTELLAVPVDLHAGSQENIDLALGINRTITGSVHGLAEGETAWVEAHSASTGHWTTTQTGQKGQFELTGLRQAVDYYIAVEAEGYQNPKPRRVNLGNAITSVANFNLLKGATIEGVLTGLTAGDRVTVEARSLQSNDHQAVSLVATEASSLPYTIHGLAGADDRVVILHSDKGNFFYNDTEGPQRSTQRATLLTLAPGDTQRGIHFDMTSVVSYTLSGVVAGLAATDDNLMVTVTAWQEGGGGFGATKLMGNRAWSLSGLSAGNYFVAVSVPNYVDQFYAGNADGTAPAWRTQPNQGTTLTLSATTAPLEITLSAGYTLTGRLTHPGGNAMPGIYVSAWDLSQDVGGGVVTRVDGSFNITGLQEGTYQVEAITSAGRVQQTLTVRQDTNLGILTLRKASGTIHGSTVAGAMVFVYDDTDTFVEVTVADRRGMYRVDGLEVDLPYRVEVDSDGDFNAMEFSTQIKPTALEPTVTVDLL